MSRKFESAIAVIAGSAGSDFSERPVATSGFNSACTVEGTINWVQRAIMSLTTTLNLCLTTDAAAAICCRIRKFAQQVVVCHEVVTDAIAMSSNRMFRKCLALALAEVPQTATQIGSPGTGFCWQLGTRGGSVTS